MNIAEIESKLKSLKIQQAEQFKKKKSERNAETLSAIREEMNKLKEEATAIYKGKKN